MGSSGVEDCRRIEQLVAGEQLDLLICLLQTKTGKRQVKTYIRSNKRNETPIHYAINHGQTTVAQLLCSFCQQSKYRFMVHHKDFRGETPLHRCAWCGEGDVARVLLDLGAKVDERNERGLVALHLAAERGNIPVMRLLIQKGANVNITSKLGNTPLHRSVACKQYESAALLLSSGADPHIINSKGNPPLDNDAVAEISCFTRDYDFKTIKSLNKNNLTEQLSLLQDALEDDDGDQLARILKANEVESLLSHYVKSNDRQETPLHYCINHFKVDCARVLLDLSQTAAKYKQLLVHHQDFRGETALHRCGWCGVSDIAEMLLVAGAKADAGNQRGLTSLHLATERGNMKMIHLLLTHGANVNVKSKIGNTPLHRAVSCERYDVASLLIEYGADINIVNEKGKPPLDEDALLKFKEMNFDYRHVKKRRTTIVGGAGSGNANANANASNPNMDLKMSGSQENRELRKLVLPDIASHYYELDATQIVMGRKLGEGSFGAVYEGVASGQMVAVKKLFSMEAKDLQRFQKELAIMCKLRHPNIVLLMGAVIQGYEWCLVMELCKFGSLDRLIKDKTITLTESQVVHIAKNVALGMNWLHTRSPTVLHLDLKPANILISDQEKLNVKISDFGLARNCTELTRTVVGSRRYMAPEMMKRKKVDEKADVYSFAIVLWELCTRQTPFSFFKKIGTKEEKLAFCEAVSSGRRMNIPKGLPRPLSNIIIQCWDTYPEQRVSFDEICTKLGRVALLLVLQDEEALDFWDRTCAMYDQKHMSWKVFKSAFQEACEASERAEMTQFELLADCLLDKTQQRKHFISLENFGHLLQSFGPFSPPFKFYQRILELITLKLMSSAGVLQQLFHPQMDTRMAYMMLAGKPPGTYLLRSSNNNTKLQPFTLSLVTADNVVEHRRVHYCTATQVYTLSTAEGGEIESKPGTSVHNFLLTEKVRGSFGLMFVCPPLDLHDSI